MTSPERKSAQPRVFPIENIPAPQLPAAGGKAAALSRLTRAGFPIPPGFCILSSAFEEAYQQTGGVPITTIPASIRTEIEAAYRILTAQPGEPLIVRSSAAQEDSASASYAGQYASIANVQGLDAVLSAVMACWNSTAETGAAVYHAAQNTPGSPVSMGVIVQRMVNGDASGVLFTRNPRTGSSRQMVVEIGYHTTEAVEQGQGTPDRLVLDKRSGAVIPRFSVHAAGKHGRPKFPLSQLAAISKKIEQLLGSAQDIEWASQDGKLWILQSRPITTQSTPREVWSRANAGEILPGVVTPLSWSVFRPVLQGAGWYYGMLPHTLHCKWRLPQGTWADSPHLFSGRAYMELHSVYAAFAGYPGVSAEVLQKALGFEFSLLAPEELPERRPRWHLMDIYRTLRFWAEIYGATHNLESGRNHLQKGSSRLLSKDISGLDPAGLLAHAAALQGQAARVLGLHISATGLAFSAYGLYLEQLRERIDPGRLQALEQLLVADGTQMSTAQHTQAIWDLAQMVKASPEAMETLLADGPFERVVERWRASRSTSELMRQWNDLLRQFGSRSTQEFELSVPRWEEDPAIILQAIKDCIQSDCSNPAGIFDPLRRSSKIEYLNNDARARRLYHAYSRLVLLRENLKYDVVRLFHGLRKTYLRLGVVLQEQNLLIQDEDIFFLDQAEIRDYLAGIHNPTLIDLAARHRLTHEIWQQKMPPAVFARVNGVNTPLDVLHADGGQGFHGIACSGGIVTAPAAVLRSLDGSQSIPSGHILIAASIDPGLTPLLLNAAGLVTEIGGILSHGATLAREFGLPAVVSVPGITQAVQDGQMITVDGFTGMVQIAPNSVGEQP